MSLSRGNNNEKLALSEKSLEEVMLLMPARDEFAEQAADEIFARAKRDPEQFKKEVALLPPPLRGKLLSGMALWEWMKDSGQVEDDEVSF